MKSASSSLATIWRISHLLGRKILKVIAPHLLSQQQLTALVLIVYHELDISRFQGWGRQQAAVSQSSYCDDLWNLQFNSKSP